MHPAFQNCYETSSSNNICPIGIPFHLRFYDKENVKTVSKNNNFSVQNILSTSSYCRFNSCFSLTCKVEDKNTLKPIRIRWEMTNNL